MASHPPSPDWRHEFEQILRQQQENLAELEARWQAVQQAWDEGPQLREALAKTRGGSRRDPALRARLRELKQQLEELELTLESRLISGLTVRMTIWNILRFGSLGFLLGWWLHR
jgi:seryl-tRNA synthetase